MPQSGVVSIGSFTAQMIRGLVAADAEIRRMGAKWNLREPGRTTLLLAPRMSAKLQLLALRHEEEGFFFKLFGTKDSTHVRANIRLSFEVRPSAAPATEVEPSTRFRIGVPRFVSFGDGGKRVRLDLDDGRWIASTGAKPAVVMIANGDVSSVHLVDDWPLLDIVALLDRVAEWLRDGAGSDPVPYRPDAEAEVSHLLRGIAAQYEEIRASMRKVNQRQLRSGEGGLSLPRHPSLGTGYELWNLESRALLQLDGKGRLVAEDKETDPGDWQQLDFVLRAEAGGSLLLRILPPDFLVKGRYHRVFLESIRTPDSVKRIWKALTKGTLGGEAALDEFLRDPSQESRACFVRIDAEDWDIVVLDAELADSGRTRFVFLMRFEVTSFPEVLPTLKDVVFLAMLPDRGRPKLLRGRLKDRKRVARYVDRFLATLRVWGRGLERGT